MQRLRRTVHVRLQEFSCETARPILLIMVPIGSQIGSSMRTGALSWLVAPSDGSLLNTYRNENRWNSTTWDEFARKWNKPVHAFLLRHVYASSISYHKMSKPSATMVTFLLSAVLHELVMAIVTKKIR